MRNIKDKLETLGATYMGFIALVVVLGVAVICFLL